MVSTLDANYAITLLTRADPTFFPGHAASIHLKIGGKEYVIGVFGILHPTVLDKYELR